MSSIAQLQAAIADALSLELSAPAIPATLEQELKNLHRMVGAVGAARPPHDRMKEAVENFRRERVFKSPAEARFACFGSGNRFKAGEPPLIEDERAFPALIRAVDRYCVEPRPYRRCYRGLLHVYFSYDGEAGAAPEP